MSRLAYTKAEAAEVCGVSEDTIKSAITRGDLKAKRSGKNADGDGVGKYLITEPALVAWLESLADA